MRNTRNTGTMMKMKIQENKQIEVSRFSGLSGYRDISHFTTTRHGGVSTGTYASMNPGVYTEDDPGFIRKNMELLSDAVGISLENMVIPHQTHEDRVLAIDASFLSLNDKERKQRLEGVDALVTNVPDVCVAVSTADCVPVLLYAPDRKVVAAVHAGWRGTVLHIARKAASLMIEAYERRNNPHTEYKYRCQRSLYARRAILPLTIVNGWFPIDRYTLFESPHYVEESAPSGSPPFEKLLRLPLPPQMPLD